MNRLRLSIGLIVLLSVAYSVSVTTWWRDRHELKAVTAANQSVRKTLGEMMVALAEKDKEIDRLTGSPCRVGERP